MVVQYRDPRQDTDTETDGNCGLNAGDIWTRVSDVPRAAGRLGRMDHAIAIETSRLGHHERQRVAMEIDRIPLATDPVQSFGPCRDPAALACVARLRTDAATHVKPQTWT